MVLAHIVPVSNENENERRTLPPIQKQILGDANSDWQRDSEKRGKKRTEDQQEWRQK
jgi:hypothetical protein